MALSDGEYLHRLYDKAKDFCLFSGTEPVTVLFRNKPQAYFEDIDTNHGGMMRKYLKDAGGDPRCPINLRLDGLFFGVTLEDGHLPSNSPFGSVRILMDLSEVFDDCTNLYFADFYCKRRRRGMGPHYITLVASKTGTDADLFCQKHLIALDLSGNNFLIKKSNGTFQTINKYYLNLEILYTEDVDVSNKTRYATSTFGQGHSRPVVGIPKDSSCSTCNI